MRKRSKPRADADGGWKDIIEDFTEVARREGRTARLTEGQLQGLREAVLDALEAHFGEIPYPIREAVNLVGSDAALRKLLRLAVTAKSLDAFSVWRRWPASTKAHWPDVGRP